MEIVGTALTTMTQQASIVGKIASSGMVEGLEGGFRV